MNGIGAAPAAGTEPVPAPGSAMEPGAGPLVLGVGNVLYGDDGIGVHAARALAHDAELPPGTRVVDGGTGGLSLLPEINGAAALILIDAVDVDAEPGTVHVLSGDDLYAGLVHLSVHQVGVADLIGAARLTGTLPERVVLVGVQPATIAPGLDLSAPVAAALPVAIDQARRYCHRLVAQEVS